MATYEIEVGGPGRVDVRKDGRAFLYDRDDLEEAFRAVTRDRGYRSSDAVWVVHSDGYRERFYG